VNLSRSGGPCSQKRWFRCSPLLSTVQYCNNKYEKGVVHGTPPRRQPLNIWWATPTEALVSMLAVAQYCALQQQYKKGAVHRMPPRTESLKVWRATLTETLVSMLAMFSIAHCCSSMPRVWFRAHRREGNFSRSGGPHSQKRWFRWLPLHCTVQYSSSMKWADPT
jgi:hypothetical protein